MSFNSYIRPACLVRNEDGSDDDFINAGYGEVIIEGERLNIKINGKFDKLLKVRKQELTIDECNEIFRAKEAPIQLEDSHICTIDQSTLSFGSAASFLGRINASVPVLLGINSSGTELNTTHHVSVFTRIASYVDWIENVVWP